MLLWLFTVFAEVVAPPGAGTALDINPAPPNSTSQWLALAMALLPVVGSIIAAKIQAKKTTHTVAESAAAAVTPRLDVGQQYLEKFVKSLEDRLEATEDKYEDLDRRYQTLLEERATLRAQMEAIRSDNADLRDEVHELRGRLRGRGRDA